MYKNIILLPTYNERNNVKVIIPEIFQLVPEINILVIDDNSPDGTAEEVKQLMKIYPNLSILERKEKTGLGNAYKDAMRRVIKDSEINAVITMDADGSHSPEYLKDFLENIKNYDLVIGSRYIAEGGIEDWEFWRKNLSRFGNLYAKILTGLPANDLTGGFMCIKRALLKELDFSHIDASGYSFQIELKFYLINKLGAKTKEIPIIFKSRREGESKISHHIIREGLIVPWRLFLEKIWKNR